MVVLYHSIKGGQKTANYMVTKVSTSQCRSIEEIGSTENGTVRNGDFLAAIKNRLYLCSAFETQMLNIKY